MFVLSELKHLIESGKYSSNILYLNKTWLDNNGAKKISINNINEFINFKLWRFIFNIVLYTRTAQFLEMGAYRIWSINIRK